jgi:hypothetical protein
MRPSVRIAFLFAAFLSVIPAAVGISIYAGRQDSSFYIIGWDELEHRSFSNVLLHEGTGSIIENALVGEQLTGSATWGTGLVIALCQLAFGTDLAYMALKWLLHVVAGLLLYQLVSKYRGERVAAWSTLFFLLYPPLLVYEVSFLKDDLVASLVIITAAVLDRRRYLLAAPLVLLTIAVRANAVLFPIILLGYLRRARLRYVLVVFGILMAVALLMLSQGYFEAMLDIVRLPPQTILFFVAKYLLGPLPTNILDYGTEAVWILPWYTLSFAGILVGFFLPGFYTSLRLNWRWIVLLLGVCLAPYLPYVNQLDIVGPRQFAAVGWLYFLLFYERLLNYHFTLRPPPAQPAQWSPAA